MLRRINRPFQILHGRLLLLGLVGATDILSLDCILDCLAYAETVIRQANVVSVASPLILGEPTLRYQDQKAVDDHGATERTFTNARIVLTELKTWFAEEPSTALPFMMSILSLRDTWISPVRVAIVASREKA